MTAYGSDPAFHRIRNGRFVCAAPEDAKCRTYPTCECETWCGCDGSLEDAADNHDLADGEHCCMTTTRSGRECWMEPWVNEATLECSYAGADEVRRNVMHRDPDGDLTIWPDGPVTTEWDDGVFWEYAEATS